MKLLEALSEAIDRPNGRITRARVVHFVFSDDNESSAYLSEIDTDELVPLLERWCAKQRSEMGRIQ